MATIKFSEFDPGNITAVGAQVVGLEGGNNKIFNAADLVNGLATTSYVDAQDTNLQNQITQNANDIANIDIDVGNIEVDTSEIESNITILQGNVTVIEGNIVVLEGAVAALQTNVTVNRDDITTIQGNIVQIENDLANINTDSQTLSWDEANANLSISNGNTVTLTGVSGGSAWTDVGNSVVFSSVQDAGVFIVDERSPAVFRQSQLVMYNSTANEGGYVASSSEILNLGHATGIDPSTNNTGTKQPYLNVFKTGQVTVQNNFNAPSSADIRFYVDGNAGVAGYIQANDFLDASGNSIIGGGGNYGDANVATYLNGNLSTNIIPDTNAAYDIGSAEYKIRHLYLSDNSLYFVDASNVEYPLNVQGGNLFFNGEQLGSGGGGNPFDQTLNTTDDVTFNAVTVNGNLDVNGSGTHAFQGTIEFSQLTNFGGTVGITDILDEPDLGTNSATALATQQSIKTYVDNAVVAGGGYTNATVTAYAEAGWQGNIIPSANITYDLGSPTNAWKDLYLSNSTIYLGGQTISVDNDGTIAFSGNISAPAVVDYTQLILNDGVLTTSRAGSTDGLEWESVVVPGSADGEQIRGVVGNDSGILAFTRYAEITYSLDNGVTWHIVHINDDLGYMGFDRYNRTEAYYSPGLNLFYILGSDGYYFTTSDFQTFSGQQLAGVDWGYIGSQPLKITESDTRLLVVSPTLRKAYYADIANPSAWTEVASLGLGSNTGVDLHYTGSAFVVIPHSQSTCRVSTDNGVTWSNGGDLKGGVNGTFTSRDSGVDPDTGTIVAGMNQNTISISTDNGFNWTSTNMTSIFTEFPSNAQIRNVSYGAGLWCINAGAYGGFDDWYDIQYVSEDITDLNTWKIINTNVPGPYSLEDQTYVNGNFWGPADDVLFKLEWPVGTQVLLFNDEVIATRKDIAYVAVAHEMAQAEKVATKELEILSKTFDGNANVVQSSTLTYESNALNISGDVTIEGNVNIVGSTNKQEYYDIREYGAVGGNVTLDTAAFEAALVDIVAAGGGELIIPRIDQRYIINVPTTGVDNTPAPRDYSNVTIRGGGEIYITNNNAGLIHIGENTENFLIEDLDILIWADADGGFGKGTIVSHYGNINKIRIQNLTIKNEFKVTTDGGPMLINFTQDLSDPTDTAEATNITVENCDLESYGRAQYGIRFFRKTRFSKVINNRITLHGTTDANNQSFNAIAMYGWAEEFLIQGNSIFGSGHSAIACSMALNGIVKENFVTNVPFNVEGGIEVENKWGHARGDTDYTTSGIKVVNNIVTNCNLGIMVTNRNAGGSTDPQPTSRGVYNVLIDGNSVYDSIESDIIVYDILSGTPVTSNVASDVRITNNSCFSTAVDGGIRFYAGKDSAINANHVKGQNVGIQLGRDTNIFVTGKMNVLGNFVEDCTTSGIVIESGNSVLRCSENNVSNVALRGVQLTTCQGGTQMYNNNYVEDTGSHGYAVRAGQTVTPGSIFRGNKTFRAGGRGFDVRLDDSIITENISVDNVTNDDFRGNVTTIISNNLSNLSS